MDIYKSDTKTAADSDIFSVCGSSSCQPVGGYTFNRTATSVVVTILELRRKEDEKWWSCRDMDKREAQFKLTVYRKYYYIINKSLDALEILVS